MNEIPFTIVVSKIDPLKKSNHIVGAVRMNNIVGYFSNTKFSPSDALVEKQKYLFYVAPIKFNRFMLIPAAFIIQMCLGSVSAFSGLSIPIEEFVYGDNHGVDRSIISNVFYVCIGLAGVGSALSGPMLARKGPLMIATSGAILFFLGNLLTALGIYAKKPELIFIGYGVIGGLGIGLTYVSPVSVLQKWFPEIKGLAAGLGVSGVSVGTIVASYSQPFIISLFHPSVAVPMAVVVLSCFYFVGMILCSIVLRFPPPAEVGVSNVAKAIKDSANDLESDDGVEDTNEINTMSLLQARTSADFILLWFMFISSQVTGLLIISKIQPMTSNQFGRPDKAQLANALIGVANTVGRLLIPLFSDLLPCFTRKTVGRKSVLMLSLAIQSICAFLVPRMISTQNFEGFITCVVLVILFYGAGFGLVPPLLVDLFGISNISGTHGMILLAYALTSVVGGFVFNAITKSETHRWAPDLKPIYNINFYWIAGVVALGLGCLIFVRTNIRDRVVPYKSNELIRVRVLNGRLLRVYKNARIECLSIEQEEVEWKEFLQMM